MNLIGHFDLQEKKARLIFVGVTEKQTPLHRMNNKAKIAAEIFLRFTTTQKIYLYING